MLTGCRDKILVSLKIMIADTHKGTRELQNIRTISDRIKNRPGSWQLCEFIDSFFHQGPNGTHQCLVQELLGPTLSTVLNFYGYDEDNREYLRPSTVLKISKQLLETVASLHSVKISHGGTSTTPTFFSG